MNCRTNLPFSGKDAKGIAIWQTEHILMEYVLGTKGNDWTSESRRRQTNRISIRNLSSPSIIIIED